MLYNSCCDLLRSSFNTNTSRVHGVPKSLYICIKLFLLLINDFLRSICNFITYQLLCRLLSSSLFLPFWMLSHAPKFAIIIVIVIVDAIGGWHWRSYSLNFLVFIIGENKMGYFNSFFQCYMQRLSSFIYLEDIIFHTVTILSSKTQNSNLPYTS